MPTTDTNREQQRLYNRRWYQKNAVKIKAHVKHMRSARRAEVRAYVRSIKLHCAQCGEDDYACLDFHHRTPKSKTMRVAQMLQGNHTLQRVIQEIMKCDILCSNCHRKLHFYAQ